MTYTFCLNNLKILRPKVKKNLMSLRKKFCEFPQRKTRADIERQKVKDIRIIRPIFSSLLLLQRKVWKENKSLLRSISSTFYEQLLCQ